MLCSMHIVGYALCNMHLCFTLCIVYAVYATLLCSRMASITISNSQPFTMTTFNMHGINQGRPMLQHICDVLTPEIIMIQEHWFTPENMNNILQFSEHYSGFGVSAMINTIGSGILVGRPYSGACILVKIYEVWRLSYC